MRGGCEGGGYEVGYVIRCAIEETVLAVPAFVHILLMRGTRRGV